MSQIRISHTRPQGIRVMTKENRALVAVTAAPKTAGPNEEGSRMRLRKTLQGLCAVVGLALALCVLAAAPALATHTHVFSNSFGEAGSGDGQLLLAEGSETEWGGSGVAVNSSTHNVYVADTGNHRVDEFSASGAFVRAWGWGVADGTTEALQACTSGCHAGLAGIGAGQLNEPSFVAVDNSGGPSQGDVYVADRTSSASNGRGFVTKFTATGGFLSSNDGSGAIMPIPGPFGRRVGGIAVDNSGDLWVWAEDKGGLGDPRASSEDVFEFAQNGSFVTDWHTGGTRTTGIAVDSAHDLFLGSVEKYTSSGDHFGRVQNGNSRGVAVNVATDDLYVDLGSPDGHGEQILRFDSSCEPANGLCSPVEQFGAGELSRAGEPAVDASNDTVYVSDVGNQRVAVFGRTPDVTTGAPVSRGATVAVVSGAVNPDNVAVSDCNFAYVADSEYASGEADPYAAGGTVPCDTVPVGSGLVTVHAEIGGLVPSVVYHFRLQATNQFGTSFGADATVPGAPPAIDSSSAADVSSASAVLRTNINPQGGDTTYRFEYGPSGGYGASIPVPDGDIGSGVSDVAASRRIQGLLAGSVYHYRVVAHNLLGTTVGSDRTIMTQPAGGIADACPNAALRAQQHAMALLDCRAYEQVSPPDKGGNAALDAGQDAWRVSPDGSVVAYTSLGVFADAQTGSALIFPYLGSRSQSGWSTHSLLPPQAPGLIFPLPRIRIYSKDLSKGVLIDGGGQFGQDEPALVPGEPANNTNLFLRDNVTSSYELIDVTPLNATPAEAELPLGSSDLSHIFFTERAQLTPDAPPLGTQPQLYEWSGGVVRLAGVLPDGSPVPASQLASIPSGASRPGTDALESHAVSDDGSRVFFEVTGGSKGLYLRQDAKDSVQLDASHGPGPGGGGEFAAASSDGSRAFFEDDATSGLTNDTVAGSGRNLYRYDANSGTLTDVTPVAGAEMQGVIGASEDGSYVYFVANGVLAPGASPGTCRGQELGDASVTCNLYLLHNGAIRFIAALNGEDLGDWHRREIGANDTAIVSPDGRYLAFQSLNSLTDYDNLAANGVQCGGAVHNIGGSPQPRCAEIFLYDAASGASGRLSCASCNPTGGAPVGPSLFAVPLVVSASGEEIPGYMPRYLSDGGRLFFNSLDALAPQDVNGQWDVYEFEPSGIGSCQQAGGCVSPVSSGTSADPSVFRDASVTGEDVFFTTSDRLLAQDGDRNADLYDARADGGIASQNEVLAPGCGGESCKQPALGQLAEQASGSSSFSGAPNPTPNSPSSHKKPTKKKHAPKKKHHSKKKPHHKRSRQANHRRGGAK
jgi:hypothetical protein